MEEENKPQEVTQLEALLLQSDEFEWGLLARKISIASSIRNHMKDLGITATKLAQEAKMDLNELLSMLKGVHVFDINTIVGIEYALSRLGPGVNIISVPKDDENVNNEKEKE